MNNNGNLTVQKISTPLHQWLLDVFLFILIKTSTRINVLLIPPYFVILEGFLSCTARHNISVGLRTDLDFDLAIPDFSIYLFWAILLWICLHVLGHYHVENSIYGVLPSITFCNVELKFARPWIILISALEVLLVDKLQITSGLKSSICRLLYVQWNGR